MLNEEWEPLKSLVSEIHLKRIRVNQRLISKSRKTWLDPRIDSVDVPNQRFKEREHDHWKKRNDILEP